MNTEALLAAAGGLVVGVGGAVAGLFRTFVQRADYNRDHSQIGKTLVRIEGKLDALARKVAAATGDPNGH